MGFTQLDLQMSRHVVCHMMPKHTAGAGGSTQPFAHCACFEHMCRAFASDCWNSLCCVLCFFFSDLGKSAEPSHQVVLERALGIRNQSSPVLRLSHSFVW